MEIELDDSGYPTEQTLHDIVIYSYNDGFQNLMESITPLFEQYGRCEQWIEDGRWHVVTGGWSGCEEVIAALKENYVFWGMCWQESSRGGSHQFQVNK